MSGGYFDYIQFRMNDAAEQLKRVIERRTYDADGEYPIPVDILADFTIGLHHLTLAKTYLQRIDWLLSGDDGENSFRKRLEEELMP